MNITNELSSLDELRENIKKSCQGRPLKNPDIVSVCVHCEKEIPSWRQYCSLKCYWEEKKHTSKKHIITCIHCHKTFWRLASHIRKNQVVQFCSRECYRLSAWLRAKGELLGKNYIRGVFDKLRQFFGPSKNDISLCCYKKINIYEKKFYCSWCGKVITKWRKGEDEEYGDGFSNIWGLQENFG